MEWTDLSKRNKISGNPKLPLEQVLTSKENQPLSKHLPKVEQENLELAISRASNGDVSQNESEAVTVRHSEPRVDQLPCVGSIQSGRCHPEPAGPP